MLCNKVLKSSKGMGVGVVWGGGRMVERVSKYKIRQPLCKISGLSYQ